MTPTHRPLFGAPTTTPVYVLDASVALDWLVRHHPDIYANNLLTRLTRVCPLVSLLWPAELVEAVRKAETSGDTTTTRADHFLSGFDVFAIEIDTERVDRVWAALISTARRYRLRVGPAAALELALRTQLPLATIDTRLRAAAARAGVAIFAP